MNVRSHLVVAGLLMAVALLPVGCGDGQVGGAAPRRGGRLPRVVARAVQTRSLDYVVRATGSLEAYQVVTVPARVAGVVGDIAFDIGDEVGPDNVLLVVDRERHALAVRESDAAVGRARATVGRARAQETSAAASLAEAQANLARREELRGRLAAAVTVEELEAARAQVARIEASVNEAAAVREEAAAALLQAEAAHAIALRVEQDAEVRAPLKGIVERRHVTAGQYVRAGDAVATLIDRSILRLRFRVGERESVKIGLEHAVTFSLSPFPGRTFRAHLVHVDAAADHQTRMVECLAEVDKPEALLKPGFFAEVSVAVGGTPDALVAPDRAIRATEDGYVAFVIVDGKAQRRLLSLGLRTDDGQAEVIAGLAPGDELVVEGAGALEDGMAVERVRPAAAPEAPAPGTGG